MSTLFDVVILTEQRYLNPIPDSEYIKNVLYEDGILKELLEQEGLKVTRKDWADKQFDWSNTKYVLFRSTWDYFDRFDEFKAWIQSTKSKTKAINPFSLIKWNMDKWYLNDLREKGIPIVETKFIKKGDKKSLLAQIEVTGFENAVIKPTIAGASRHLYKLDRNNISAIEPLYKSLVAQEDMMSAFSRKCFNQR